MTPSPESPPRLEAPPLGLYVHLPWCVRKCPYCDFNSHALRGELPTAAYVDALLADLEQDLPLAWGRTVATVFLGGGTPSLFPGREIDRLLAGIRARVRLHPAAEVTLEANPGAVERDRFEAYRAAGVTRVSLGVQSFDDEMLRRIGRIHDGEAARAAARDVARAGFDQFNIDLMYALPGQSPEGARRDVAMALDLGPTHVSHYQLTLEPNTLFAAEPPALPDEDDSAAMQDAAGALLEAAGFRQYEVSAWAKPGRECRHNLNYWRYGDFLGVGAGAHAKVTDTAGQRVLRLSKERHPKRYLAARATGAFRAEERALEPADRVFEFFLNQLRLRDGVDLGQLGPRAGVAESEVAQAVAAACGRGLLERHGDRLVPTALGWRFVNEAQQLFLP